MMLLRSAKDQILMKFSDLRLIFMMFLRSAQDQILAKFFDLRLIFMMLLRSAKDQIFTKNEFYICLELLKQMVTKCEICFADKLSKTNQVVCPFCPSDNQHVICLDCAKKVIIDQTETGKPLQCIFCKTMYNYFTLLEIFPKSWVNNARSGYRYYEKVSVLQSEKARIQELMEEAAEYKKANKLAAEIKEIKVTGIQPLYEEKRELEKKIKSPYDCLKCGGIIRYYHAQKCPHCHTLARDSHKYAKGQFLAQVENIKNEIEDWNKKIEPIRIEIAEIVSHWILEGGGDNKPTVKYLCPCPYNECKGLVRATPPVCAVCEREVCTHCHEVLESGHKCDLDTVASVKKIRKESKACPKCAAPISKITGCSQMWCASCHAVFDWNSGKIEEGFIHNPHAIQWMRENGILEHFPNDLPCGGPDHRWVDLLIRSSIKKDQSDSIRELYALDNLLFGCFIGLHEMQPVGTKGYLLDYIIGKTNDKRIERKLYSIYRENQRRAIERELLRTFITICIERFRDLSEKFVEIQENQTLTLKCVKPLVNKMISDIRKCLIFLNQSGKKRITVLGSTKWSIADPKTLMPSYDSFLYNRYILNWIIVHDLRHDMINERRQ